MRLPLPGPPRSWLRESLHGGSVWTEFAADSSLEGNGFELQVPRPIGKNFEALSEMGTSC